MEKNRAYVIYPSRCILGEGSLWDDQNNKLLWGDIMDNKIYCFDPVTKSNLGFDIGKNVGTVVLTDSGVWGFADEDGFGTIDPKTGEIKYGIQPLKTLPEIRFNDGKCDPRGDFWAGTMAYNCSHGAGTLYSFSGWNNVTIKISNVTISNGLVWNKARSKFYFIDSLTYEVHGYDYNFKTGNITNRKIVATIDKNIGLPDGMTIDVEDHLWVALFYGGKVIRICPESGETVYEVNVPAPNVTSCAFGGKHLDELYITTAQHAMDEKSLMKFPDAGSLFKAKVPFKGTVTNKMKL